MSPLTILIVKLLLLTVVICSLVEGGHRNGLASLLPTRRLTIMIIITCIVLWFVSSFLIDPFISARGKKDWFSMYSNPRNGYGSVPAGDCISWFDFYLYHQNMGLFELFQFTVSGDKSLEPWMVPFLEFMMSTRLVTVDRPDRALTPRALCTSILPPILVCLKTSKFLEIKLRCGGQNSCFDEHSDPIEITLKDIDIYCDPYDHRWVPSLSEGIGFKPTTPPVFSVSGYLPTAVQTVVFQSQTPGIPRISPDILGAIMYKGEANTNLAKGSVKWWPTSLDGPSTPFQRTWKDQFNEWGTRFSDNKDGIFRYNVPPSSESEIPKNLLPIFRPWVLTPSNFLFQKWGFPPDAPFIVSFLTNNVKMEKGEGVNFRGGNDEIKKRNTNYIRVYNDSNSPEIFKILVGQSDYNMGEASGGVFGYTKSLGKSPKKEGINTLIASNLLFTADKAWDPQADAWANNHTNLPMCPKCTWGDGFEKANGGTVNKVCNYVVAALVVGSILSCIIGCEGFLGMAAVHQPLTAIIAVQVSNTAARAVTYAQGVGSSCRQKDDTKTKMAVKACCDGPSAESCKMKCEFIHNEDDCKKNGCKFAMNVCARKNPRM